MAIKQSMSNLVVRRGLNLVIYGPAGSGKTTLAAQLADSPEYGAPVTFVDAEGGTSVLSDRSDIDVQSVTNSDGRGWTDIKSLCDKIIDGKYKHPLTGDAPKTVVLDNLSEYKEMCKAWVVENFARNIDKKDRPDQNDWGKVNSDMLLFVRKMRDFARSSTTNVIFIAWDLPEMNDSGNVIKNAINMNPAFRRDFPGIVDHVAYLRVSMGRRIISFASDSTTDAKIRRNATEVANSIPDEIRYKGRELKPLADIFATLLGNEKFPTEKYAKGSNA